MNKTTAIIGGVAVLLALGLVVYITQNPAPATTTTPNTTIPDTTGTTSQTPAAQPAAPSAITNSATTPFTTAAAVTGSVAPNGAFTSYWYEYGTTANLGSHTSSGTIGSGYAAIPAPGYILNLSKDTTYYFRLVAQNQFGQTEGAQYTFHTTVSAPPAGSIPSIQTLQANGVSRTTATMNGTVTPNKNSTVYWFEYGQSTNLGNTTALQSVGDGTAKVPASLSLSNLTPATTYYYRLDAQNQFGTVNGAIMNFKTSGPATPTPVSAPVVTTQLASPVATTTADLRGTVNPYSTQTTYWFEYSTDSGFGSSQLKTTPQRSAGAGATTVSIDANVTGLRSRTTYYYRTVAQNTGGTVRGERQSFTTK